MRHLITITILCVGIFTNADAQTFTQRIQKATAGQGTVTIHQDSVIEQLVNNAPLGVKTGTPAKPQTAKPTHTSQPSSASSASQTSSTNQTSQSTLAPDTTDTSKKLIRNGYKITGYRVQAFAGGNSRADRIKAEQTGDHIKAQFADVPTCLCTLLLAPLDLSGGQLPHLRGGPPDAGKSAQARLHRGHHRKRKDYRFQLINKYH